MGKFCVPVLVFASFLGSPQRLTVNLSILELSRRNAIIKEQVNLAEGAVLGLGKAEPAPDIAEKVCAGVKEAGFGSPVPG